jgi:import inner membrane translocase subunit TIM54
MNTPNTDPVSPSVLPSPAQPQPPTSLPSSALNAQSTTPNSAPNATTLPKAAPKPIPEPPLIPYTGLPSSFPKKLPHRNWFIFAAVVSIPTYLWWDDRQQAKALKEAYLDRVRHLGREPLEGGALGGVRTCAVYASRWPGEEDGKARDWWKKYVKVGS